MIFNVFVFLVVLSVLVFFHELGHFLAAKWCGIYVKRFSVGMPPRLFGVQVGETDYCIGALPFGGFVMMAGQEDVPLSDEERTEQYGEVPPERWFRNRPVWQRLLVLFMGPFMNLILAVALYWVVAVMGGEVPEWELSPRVGVVEENSAAAAAPLRRMDGDTVPDLSAAPDATGWKTGDLIVSVNGRAIGNIGDLAAVAVLGGAEREHDIVLERETAPGEKARFFSRLAPRMMEGERHPRFGVGPFETAQIGAVTENSPAAAAGLQEGDVILRANGEPVSLTTFIRFTEQMPEGGAAVLDVRRGGETLSVEVRPETIGRILGLSIGPVSQRRGTDGAEPSMVVTISDALRESTGLRPKDVLLEINGQPATADLFFALQRENPGGSLSFKVRRPAVLMGLWEKEGTLTLDVPVEPVRAVGVALEFQTAMRRYSPARAVPRAFQESWLAVERTVLTLKGLLVGDVSAKDLGGPVMIFDVTAKAAQAGLGWLIRITAFISVNLFIFNLLPLPVLDGGQIVTSVVEGIRRKPLSDRFMERFQQAGLVMIVALMLFVTYNDILRKLQEFIP